MRCVIVDDNRGFADAARMVLQRGEIEVVGVASSSVEAVECVRRTRPDFALVDVDLGDESGLDLAARLRDAVGSPSPRVILTSTEPDFGHLVDRTCAVGFLPKSELSAPAVLRLLRSDPAHRDSR